MAQKKETKTMTDNAVIQARGLTKYFGPKPAVYELGLRVLRACDPAATKDIADLAQPPKKQC